VFIKGAKESHVRQATVTMNFDFHTLPPKLDVPGDMDM
jgi:hypothetical protein